MQIAIDKLINQFHLIKNFGRIGLVVNQSSTTSNYIPTVDVIFRATKKTKNTALTVLFGPQHGYGQTEQDNMKETEDSFFILDDGSKIPLYSLYSKTREPLEEHLKNVDTLIVDLQDIGCRVYTYMLTLAGCLKSAAKFGKKIVVLDRPNPLGLCYKTKNKWMRIEGNCLDTRWKSFVGLYSIPMRHGLTMGELGHFFIKSDGLNVDYSVIRVNGLKRTTPQDVFKKSHWIMPSPNIPTWQSAHFFPSFVCLEGTNVSEGRGTTVPFELIGAPWLNAKQCIEFFMDNKNLFLNSIRSPFNLGLREHHFRPTFNKYAGQDCHGIHFGVMECSDNLNLFALGMTFLYYCNFAHKNDFQWTTQEYEYNTSDLPIHLILGTDNWQKMFTNPDKNCDSLKEMLDLSHQDAQTFIKNNQDILIYE